MTRQAYFYLLLFSVSLIPMRGNSLEFEWKTPSQLEANIVHTGDYMTYTDNTSLPTNSLSDFLRTDEGHKLFPSYSVLFQAIPSPFLKFSLKNEEDDDPPHCNVRINLEGGLLRIRAKNDFGMERTKELPLVLSGYEGSSGFCSPNPNEFNGIVYLDMVNYHETDYWKRGESGLKWALPNGYTDDGLIFQFAFGLPVAEVRVSHGKLMEIKYLDESSFESATSYGLSNATIDYRLEPKLHSHLEPFFPGLPAGKNLELKAAPIFFQLRNFLLR